MKIQQVQAQSFQGKKHFLTKSNLEDMHNVLKKMNMQTTCKENNSEFSTKILGGLSIQDKAYFADKRYLLKPADDMFGESTMEFGRVKLTFDNKTGEVTKSKKPFYKSWKSVLKETGELLSSAKNNFDNDKIIAKKFIGISGFTKRAGKKLLETVDKVQKVFLEPLNGVF